MPEFFNRCEVRDITGETASVLFGNDAGVFDFRDLRVGASLFVRYACKCYFSDLATQVGGGGVLVWRRLLRGRGVVGVYELKALGGLAGRQRGDPLLAPPA
jgi:hypothetical protein